MGLNIFINIYRLHRTSPAHDEHVVKPDSIIGPRPITQDSKMPQLLPPDIENAHVAKQKGKVPNQSHTEYSIFVVNWSGGCSFNQKLFEI